jgi:TonB family protein
MQFFSELATDMCSWGALNHTSLPGKIFAYRMGDWKPTMTKNRFFVLLVGGACLLSTAFLHADTRKATKTASPTYPPLAAKMKVEGTVKIEATINDAGAVEEAKVISGHALLAPAAVEAVKKFRYEPGGGKSTQMVNVDFVLPH